MKYSEVLNRYVNTGLPIPEEQYNLLSPSLQKSYKRMRGVVGYEDWEFKFLTDDERIKFIEKKGKELNNHEVEYLLEYSKDKDLIATKIIDTIGREYPNSLYGYVIKQILDYSVNKDDIIKKIIEVKNIHLNFDNITLLLQYSSNKNDIATKIIEIIGDKLNLNIIRPFLNHLRAPVNVDLIDMDDLITKIIKAKGGELTKDEKFFLRLFSRKKYDIIIKIIEIRGEELTDEDIIELLIEAITLKNERDLILTKIIETKGKKLNYEPIVFLLSISNDKELIKKTLLQNGVDYKLINNVIIENDLPIPLIPDNYQEMLNEIRRIKQIMG